MKTIQLSQTKYAFIDDEDFDTLSKLSWWLEKGTKTFYAVSKEHGKRVPMQSKLLAPPAGMEVDHINGNGLDNRKINLRACTQKENGRNCRKRLHTTSKYKGVYRGAHSWRSRIKVDGKIISLGSFKSETRAALMYDVAARKYFGEFAKLNFPKDKTQIYLAS